jgi:hypothetical protein
MTSKGEDYITKLERTFNKMNDSTLTQLQPNLKITKNCNNMNIACLKVITKTSDGIGRA